MATNRAKEVTMLREEVLHLHGEVNRLRAELDNRTGELAKMTQEHVAALDKLTERDQQLHNALQQHETSVKLHDVQLQLTVDQLGEAHNAKLGQLKEEHEQLIAHLKEEHAQVIEALNKQHLKKHRKEKKESPSKRARADAASSAASSVEAVPIPPDTPRATVNTPEDTRLERIEFADGQVVLVDDPACAYEAREMRLQNDLSICPGLIVDGTYLAYNRLPVADFRDRPKSERLLTPQFLTAMAEKRLVQLDAALNERRIVPNTAPFEALCKAVQSMSDRTVVLHTSTPGTWAQMLTEAGFLLQLVDDEAHADYQTQLVELVQKLLLSANNRVLLAPLSCL